MWNRALPEGELAALARAREFVRPGQASVVGRDVALTLGVQGVPDVAVRMQFSFDGQTWTALEPLARAKTLPLPEGVGARRVFVCYTGPDGRAVVVVDSVTVDLPARRPGLFPDAAP